MKMYYFACEGSCGEEYHVMAQDRRAALDFLKKYCLENDRKSLRRNLLQYGLRKEYVFPNKITFPNSYVVTMETEQEGIDKTGCYMKDYNAIAAQPERISEHGEGEIVQTEVD